LVNVGILYIRWNPLHNETRENRKTVVSDVFTCGSCAHAAKIL
jgi:hypothetical protein